MEEGPEGLQFQCMSQHAASPLTVSEDLFSGQRFLDLILAEGTRGQQKQQQLVLREVRQSIPGPMVASLRYTVCAF